MNGTYHMFLENVIKLPEFQNQSMNHIHQLQCKLLENTHIFLIFSDKNFVVFDTVY